MKILKFGVVFILLFVGTEFSTADVILNFDDVPGGNNTDVPTGFGSNLAEAPNVSLTWAAAGNTFERHSSNVWSSLDSVDNVNIVQLDMRAQNADAYIRFSVDDGFQLRLNSFLMGNATDQTESAYRWDIEILRDSDLTSVYSQSTAFLGPGDVDTVAMNFLGDAGEDYRLVFGQTAPNTIRTAIDDLSFGQQAAVPEPSSLALLAFGLGFVGIRKCRNNKARKSQQSKKDKLHQQ